ncbi:acyl-CoA dehydrogenase [Stagonosporopsis vannaccii]|nr:acyl-CoA dehydrogenase [Stagonosporopsis vannaccii]
MLKAVLEVQPELKMSPTPSSSTAGFFQDLPTLPPQYTSPDTGAASANQTTSASFSDDKVLARILDLYLPANRVAVTSHLERVARIALDPRVLAHATDAETNHPVLRSLTTFGQENRNDPLWTTSGWQRLKEIGYAEGVVAVAYSQAPETAHLNRRIYEFSLGHLWSVTGTMTGCPMSMTDGAATLLSRHLKDPDADQTGRVRVFEEAFRRLTSRDPKYAWTSGQWMTERSGGSDVSQTETLATRLTASEMARDEEKGRSEDAVGMPLGPWKIDGFKWFSSATDSEMAVLLARTDKGLSAFYMPMRRRRGGRPAAATVVNLEAPPETELNGVRIQRLKNKLGTKSLPTAELELRGARAWLIGTEGRGVAEISAVLNITRLSTAAGSVANWSRGLAICRAYSQVRKVRGGLLQDNPTHLRWMADETIKYHAGAHFTFLGVALQGALEQSHRAVVSSTKAAKLIPADKTEVALLLRLLLPVMKAQVSVASVHGLRQCMECLGGVGYCENNEDGGLLNVAKIYRDNLVNPIWEGTVSVMAEDVVRVLTDKRLGDGDILRNVFVPWVSRVLEACDNVFQKEIVLVSARLDALLKLTDGTKKEELLYRGRELLDHLEAIVSAAVLLYDATANPSFVAQEVARRWVRSKGLSASEPDGLVSWKDAVRIEKSIFLGTSHVEAQRLEKL